MSEQSTAASDDRLGIAEVIDRAPATTSPDRSLEEVVLDLVGRGISGMPVLDEHGVLVGVVSEHDVIAKRGQTVGDVMSRGVISSGEDAEAAELARLMGLHGIRLVPILRDGALVGVVSRAGLVRLYATSHWVCRNCGAAERGLSRPRRCGICGGSDFSLERTG